MWRTLHSAHPGAGDSLGYEQGTQQCDRKICAISPIYFDICQFCCGVLLVVLVYLLFFLFTLFPMVELCLYICCLVVCFFFFAWEILFRFDFNLTVPISIFVPVTFYKIIESIWRRIRIYNEIVHQYLNFLLHMFPLIDWVLYSIIIHFICLN